MKITILSSFDTFGGASISGLRLHQTLLKAGLNSAMLVQEKKSELAGIHTISKNWFQKKLSFIRFVLDRLQFLFYEKSKEVRFAFSTAKIGINISKHKLVNEADIIHLFWINFGFLSLNSIEKLGKNKKPILWNLQDMWPFTGGCHYSGDCLGYENNCGNCQQFLRKPSDNDLSNHTFERKLEKFKNLNLIIVPSSNWLAEKAKNSLLFKNYPIITIPTPIDTNIFQPISKQVAKASFELLSDKKYILFAAVKISDKRKGFSYFKEAMAFLKESEANTEDIEVLVFGQAEASDFEAFPFKVNILGQLSDLNSIAKAYSAASVFVIPSLEDNLPNTIIEAMACGTPVVGFEVGGIPEMIEHKKTGYLAKYKNAEDLSTGINFVLYEADYEALSKNSRKKAVETYEEEVVTKQYKNLYKSLLK